MDLVEATYRATKQFPPLSDTGSSPSCAPQSPSHRTSRKVMYARWAIISDICSFPAVPWPRWRHSSSWAPDSVFSRWLMRSLCCNHATKLDACW